MNKKRKVTKRITAWLLSFAMVLTTINLPAFSLDVKAAETVSSSITIDGKEYTLFTGFTATDGTFTEALCSLSNAVDGDITTRWTNIEPAPGYAYVEFTSDVPIILKGYRLNSYHETNYHPSEWRLFAKADEDAEYDLVSEYTDQTYSGTEHKYPVVNEENLICSLLQSKKAK